MTKPPKRPRDLNQWAKRMVDITSGEVDEPKRPTTKVGEKEAAEIGGRKRAQALTPKRRTEIASIAAKSSWTRSARENRPTPCPTHITIWPH